MRLPLPGEPSARWLLVLCGTRGSPLSAVAAHVAAYSGADRVPDHRHGTDRDRPFVAEVARRLDTTGRVVVELSLAATARRRHDVLEALATVSGVRKVPLLVVEFTTSAVADDMAIERRSSSRAASVSTRSDSGNGAAALDGTEPCSPSEAGDVVSIGIRDLTAEQIAALLRPVLIGPRRPHDLRQHLERRISTLSLEGRPVDGHSVTQRISRQLARDAEDRRLLDRWWFSTVIDENTDRPMIERETFRWIEQLAKPASGTDWPVSHAGLLHTYGYLLSAAWTPYGWKGDRYLDGTLAGLLRIDLDDLTPWAGNGTVLSNLTVALDRLIASEQPDHLTVETGRLAVHSGDAVRVRLRTRIYPRHHTLTDRLLVYSVEFSGSGIERYITSFPVGNRGVAAILADERPRSRFNIAGELLSGSRSAR